LRDCSGIPQGPKGDVCQTTKTERTKGDSCRGTRAPQKTIDSKHGNSCDHIFPNRVCYHSCLKGASNQEISTQVILKVEGEPKPAVDLKGWYKPITIYKVA